MAAIYLCNSVDPPDGSEGWNTEGIDEHDNDLENHDEEEEHVVEGGVVAESLVDRSVPQHP